ncbi:hypothetical protein VE03_07238 [Pseudogymnoascus sp. 23342-1-I1]|nr:hypothetical protein VE03_07238 [Pseudogymnoascus sp. 23342-1-I1]
MVPSVLGKRSRMRTYANRVRKDTADSPAKRVFIEAVEPLQDITNLLPVTPPLVPKSKRSIADYFTKPPASANASSQPQKHIHSSTPSLSEILPSSPPPLEPYHTGTKPPIRKRRRLTTRPRAIKPARPQTIKPNKMATPEDYGGPVFSSDSDSSSWDSSWEDSLIGEYATAQEATAQATTQDTTDATSRTKGRKRYGKARSNSFTSTSAKGPDDTGRARSKTKAGGEGMAGEFSDMVYDYQEYFSSVLYTRASTTAPNGTKIPGRVQNNTRADRDAEKAYPIPAYSDSSSTVEATPAGSSTGGNDGGQKENTKPGKLVQTQINLGQNPITTCNVCKFTLNRTVVEDVKAHDRFHQAFVNLAERLDMDKL